MNIAVALITLCWSSFRHTVLTRC